MLLSPNPWARASLPERNEEEEEDFRQFMKDRAKKPPSKKIEGDDSLSSFLTPDNKIGQQPGSRKLADASSSSTDDSTPLRSMWKL